MKTALILPGGWTKGAIEFGACKVILKKIMPDLIIGTSVGAINAVKLADSSDIDKNIQELENCWLDFRKKDFFPLNLEVFYKFHFASSFYSNKGLYKILNENLKSKTFEELSMPVYVNCTNMISGKSEFFSEGEVINPIVASCSAVPLFPPVEINNIPYIDGSFGSYLGIEKAIELKCKRIILINMDNHETYNVGKKTIKEYSSHMLAITASQNIRNALEICKDHKIQVIEVSPVPQTYTSISTSLNNTKEMIKLGQDAANKIIDEL